ncbi:MAG: 16S rRNA (adenine(1518)-N(6)/adenine(1519)-N(6))-dimethyltransferase RsmA [Spirochaetaceae bacterium]|nr:16S rRNA (adenine(1518)-N(6)/adenine(1519)-N(6))-dimethyltransferase RsmA [Spirochaetaceae bacterium]
MLPSPLPDYNSPSRLRLFLESRGLGARKRYGQNFLINPGARTRLLDALELPRAGAVWEPGPGLGAMTAPLLEQGGDVTAFEIDAGFSSVLRDIFGGQANFTLIEGDMLKTWPGAGNRGDYLLGNLPYNTGAALLADFIEKGKFFTRMVVTVQKETGRRMCARPGEADYSSFSVLCASRYRITPLFSLKGSAFYPEPRVESLALRLDLREDGPFRSFPPPASFFPLLRALFASRRKTVKNNLERFIASSSLMMTKTAAEWCAALLARSGVAGDSRAETLDLAAIVSLAESFDALAGPAREKGLPRG